jgi:flavin-dependent dehydrogenase
MPAKQFASEPLFAGLSETLWDAIIVGAGPAGGISAGILAGNGWKVLLLDRSPFPREKTCGGCINAAAATALREIGLGSVLRGAPSVDQLRLSACGHRLNVPLPPGFAISRAELDARIAGQALSRGCVFVSGVSAQMLPASLSDTSRLVKLRRGNLESVCRAGIVLACDGINGSLMDQEPGAQWRIAKDSWFGVSLTLAARENLSERGAIEMNVALGGYAGLVRLADDRVHVGAALDSDTCRSAGGPGILIESILHQCGQPGLGAIGAEKFHGTGRLTRRRNKLGAYRVLAVGDACGYVEPFTGEGISWAVRGACEVTQLLAECNGNWRDDLADLWTVRHRATLGRWQMVCHTLRALAHRPRLADACVSIASMFPALAGGVARMIGQPSATYRNLCTNESPAVEGIS